jgi:hypothetical protein
MSAGVSIQTEKVADGRLATSAQPPRATPMLDSQVSSEAAPHPIRSLLLPDDPGALRVGLNCSTASRPLPTRTLHLGKPYRDFCSHSGD